MYHSVFFVLGCPFRRKDDFVQNRQGFQRNRPQVLLPTSFVNATLVIQRASIITGFAWKKKLHSKKTLMMCWFSHVLSFVFWCIGRSSLFQLCYGFYMLLLGFFSIATGDEDPVIFIQGDQHHPQGCRVHD